jgi:glutathione synthase/RimK-type ligase-like ATP-grasp enzyme
MTPISWSPTPRTSRPPMRTIIVVNDVAHGPVLEGTELVAARDYLSDPSWAEKRGCRVLNLCRSYRYQKAGYYTSLLAHARGHRPLPSLATMQAAKSSTIVRFVSDELYDEVQRSFAGEPSGSVTLEIFFGRETSGQHLTLGAALFGRLALPLMRAAFVRNDRSGEWSLTSCAPLATEQLAPDRRMLLVEAMRTFLRRRHTPHRPDHGRYDLAILHDPREAEPPSNEEALRQFQKAAEAEGFAVELIEREDYARVGEFDALFIRETTAVNHRTFRFAQRASAAGLVVIDDPESILRCTNKVYLAEALGRHGIAAPRTMIAHRGNLGQVAETLGFPCVLKQPDSSFSQGVVKAADAEEYRAQTARLLRRSELLVAQAFMPTDFDWRIGVLARKPLFACKYYMARWHWQVVRREGNERTEGSSECVPLPDVPAAVLDAAVRAANLIGDGLYGVDLKEVGSLVYVIEVNDNPSIDAATEDQLLGDSLYRTLMADFRRRLDERRRVRTP